MTEVTDPDVARRVRDASIRLVPICLSGQGLNPLAELSSLLDIWWVFRQERPDLVHAIAQKPVLWGALAVRLAGPRAMVGTLAGMGLLFI